MQRGRTQHPGLLHSLPCPWAITADLVDSHLRSHPAIATATALLIPTCVRGIALRHAGVRQAAHRSPVGGLRLQGPCSRLIDIRINQSDRMTFNR